MCMVNIDGTLDVWVFVVLPLESFLLMAKKKFEFSLSFLIQAGSLGPVK